jgi:predicted nucleic acid-binding protein
LIVIDASFALALALPDEDSPTAESIAELLLFEVPVVPSIWVTEVANSVLSASRRGRLREADEGQVAQALHMLDVKIEPIDLEGAIERILPLARKHGLSIYDAAYLELAQSTSSRLATLDRKLRKAALAEGVSVLDA